MVGTSACRKDGGKNDEERRLVTYMNSWYLNDLSPGRGDFDRITCMPAVFVKMLANINFLVVFLVNVHLYKMYICSSLMFIVSVCKAVLPSIYYRNTCCRSILTWDLSRTMNLFDLRGACTTQCIICSCPNQRSWLFNWLCLWAHHCRNVAGTCFYDAVQLSPLMHHSAIAGSIGSPFAKQSS